MMRSKLWTDIIFLLPVLVVTFILYLPVRHFGFLNYDDTRYILENPLITGQGSFVDFFTSFYDGHYHPLTLLSFALDYRIGGGGPGAFHITSLLLHLLNAALVFIFIRQLKGSPALAFAVTALFALSPLTIESVAWISERKNLLYTLFFLAALIFYLRYSREKRRRDYILSLVLLVLSLLGKAQGVPFVLVISAIDIYLGRRWKSRPVLLEKLPFYAIVMVFGIVAILAQGSFWSESPESAQSLTTRLIAGSWALVLYLIRPFIPFGQSPLHPYPLFTIEPAAPAFALLLALPALLFFTYFFLKKKSNDLFLGMFFFLANITLLLKFLPFPAGDYFMADRYAYLPSVGLYFAAGAWFTARSRNIRIGGAILLAVMLIESGWALRDRLPAWENSVSLWTEVLRRHPGSVQALNDRGNAYSRTGQFNRAMEDFTQALRSDPENAFTYNNRGSVKARAGDFEGAVRDFDQALSLKPDYADAWLNRANALLYSDRPGLALADAREAIRLKPEFSLAYHTRALIYDRLGSFDDARADLDKALVINPQFAEAYATRATLNNKTGRFDRALSDAGRAIEAGLSRPGLYFERALAHYNLKEFQAALRDLDQAVQRDQGVAEYYFYRGYCHYNLGDWASCIGELTAGLQLEPGSSLARAMRGLAFIREGDRDRGCADLRQAAAQGHEIAAREFDRLCR
jgi:tetratricopeptide (TPR) repeat protein